MSRKSKAEVTRFTRQAARPIDKNIVFVTKNAVGTSQVVTTLKTVTFPCTFVGIMWNLNFASIVTSGDAVARWAIVVVKDGNSANTLGGSDAGDLYTPETNVLVWGVSMCSDIDSTTGPSVVHETGTTKTMRKLMGGDLLQFIMISDIAASLDVRGAVQFFCKT